MSFNGWTRARRAGPLSFAVSGGAGATGTLLTIAHTHDPPGRSGAWWEYAANLGGLAPGETVTITSGAGGAIIDRLTLVPEPATMIARRDPVNSLCPEHVAHTATKSKVDKAEIG